ncbi:MAG: PspC domain-containing protein [Xanthomonadales bacterium]|nr:PspC domain-containing protein [Xanthomonadales bacterium]
MTSDHRNGHQRHDFSRQASARVDRRPDGALLAGVCAWVARRFGWSAWALRALFVLGLLIEPITTGIVYLVLAFVLPRIPQTGQTESRRAHGGDGLASESLRARNARIADLERRFRNLERKGH